MAELAVGIIPLIAVAFKAYNHLQDLKSDYQNFDKDLKKVVDRIYLREVIFRNSMIGLFKSTSIPESARLSMFDNLDSGDWELPIFDIMLTETLGGGAYHAKTAILGIVSILSEIKALLPLATTCTDSFVVRHPQSTEIIQTSVLGRLWRHERLRPARQEAFPRGASGRRLRRLAGRELKRLKELSEELREDIYTLQGLLTSIEMSSNLPRPTQPGSNSLPITKTSNPDITDLLSVQAKSLALHNLVFKVLMCCCHAIHLMLDGRYEVFKNSSNGKSLAEPHPQFVFRLNFDPELPISISFVSTQSHTSNIASIAHCADREICKEVASMGMEDVKLISSTVGTNHDGFLLRRTPCLQLAYPPSSVNAHLDVPKDRSLNFLTIQELIQCKNIDLATPDQLRLAGRLSCTLMTLYSSPWIKGWNVKSIGFFETLEGPIAKFGHWTPYLLLDRESQERPSTNNSGYIDEDLYSFGLILLQIGSWRILQHSDRDLPRIHHYLHCAANKLGPYYECLVRECLGIGSGGAINLQESSRMKDFLSRVSKLEEIAQSFG